MLALRTVTYCTENEETPGRTDGPDRQGNPINLRFHDARHGSVSFWRTPDHPFGPRCKLAQILDLGVRFGLAVGQRESSRIEDLDFASHGLKKTCRFEDQKPAVRTLTQGSVEQQERWQGSRRDATASRRSVPSSAGRPKVP